MDWPRVFGQKGSFFGVFLGFLAKNPGPVHDSALFGLFLGPFLGRPRSLRGFLAKKGAKMGVFGGLGARADPFRFFAMGVFSLERYRILGKKVGKHF